MRKRIILITLTFFVAFTAVAQRISIATVETKLITHQGYEFVGEVVEKSNGLFLFSNWRNNGVLYYNGKELSISNINFNISDNSLSCKLKNGKYFVFRSADIPKFSINNQLFKKNGRYYFEVLIEEGNVYFYKRYDVRYKEGVTHRIGGGEVSPSKKLITYTYLIKSGDVIKTLESNKKSILSFFASEEEALKKFVKEKGLSYKKEQDLVKIITYMLKKSNHLS